MDDEPGMWGAGWRRPPVLWLGGPMSGRTWVEVAYRGDPPDVEDIERLIQLLGIVLDGHRAEQARRAGPAGEPRQ